MEGRRLKVTYDEYGDTKTEDIDEHGDIIYKAEDCEIINRTISLDNFIHAVGDCEMYLHKPTGKKIIVPTHIERHWELAWRSNEQD